jgi:hypothetical protein
MSIKGYGPVKEAAVARWREVVASLRTAQAAEAEPRETAETARA